MELKAKKLEIKKSLNGDSELIFTVSDKDNKIANLVSQDESLKKDIRLNFKKWRERRSLDANAYMWVLLGKIAKHKDINVPVQDLYKKFIRSKGVYQVVPVKADVVDDYIRKFASGGSGWVCDVLGDSKLKGYVNVMTFFGSSVYDTKEMKVLLDEVIYEAEQLGIQTATPEEQQKMLSLMEKKNV